MEKVKIDQNKNEVFVTFNRTFYKEEFIEQAIENFQKICSIEKTEEKIILKPKEKLDINKLGYEFYNYVLGLMKNSP